MQDLVPTPPASFLGDDEVLCELRALRKAHAEAHGHDIAAMFAAWREVEERLARAGKSLVSRPPRRPGK